MAFIKYGMMWQDTYHPVEIERYCIRRDGEWRSPIGTKCGAGLFTHYRNLMSLLWPGDDHHRWSDLILKSWLEERILVVMGCRDSGKTYVISKCVLIDYWAYPEETLTLMTSTTIQGLENRIWRFHAGSLPRSAGLRSVAAIQMQPVSGRSFPRAIGPCS